MAMASALIHRTMGKCTTMGWISVIGIMVHLLCGLITDMQRFDAARAMQDEEHFDLVEDGGEKDVFLF